jgi:hypothetical protein
MPDVIAGPDPAGGWPNITKAPTPAAAYGREAARLEKSPETMIIWLSRAPTDQLATLMQPGGFGVGGGAAVGLVAGCGVGVTVGAGVAVGVASGVGSAVGVGVSDTTMVGVGVAASAGSAVGFPETIESRTTPNAVRIASPLATVTTHRQ